jgi:hypothetical protein
LLVQPQEQQELLVQPQEQQELVQPQEQQELVQLVQPQEQQEPVLLVQLEELQARPLRLFSYMHLRSSIRRLMQAEVQSKVFSFLYLLLICR